MVNTTTLAHAVRFLSIDAVNQAKSGHPGMPMGMADIATVLWRQFIRHNPTNPQWFNRDRFVLSNGHGSMLLYAILHLTGYKLSGDDLKQFRQLHSKTPGHPECTDTPGVEATTGPLGQGLANAVGMALAEKVLATEFNTPEIPLVDHYTYAFTGDGCLMEGISHEACSFAGTLGLGKLIVFYDDNGISIDGDVSSWFGDDTAGRFEAYHWHVIRDVNGHDPGAIAQAIKDAQAETSKPTLIICKTIIGYGSTVENTAKVHGAPLSEDDITQLRARFDWSYPPFEIPDPISKAWRHVSQGQEEEQAWLDLCQAYQTKHPDKYVEFLRRINGDLPDAWQADNQTFIDACRQSDKSVATRKASQQCIEHFAALLPELLGGSADLTESNCTDCSHSDVIKPDHFAGNYIHYGVREFAMSAIMNGLALHGGLIPFGGTFLAFSDYAKSAVRSAALMQQRVIFVYSHDSIGLGEDGPTHQPVEQLAALRMTPNMMVWRPASLLETAVAWEQAIEHHTGPSALLLTRQTIPALKHSEQDATGVRRGAYIVLEPTQSPDVIFIATGSEVQLALAAANQLNQQDLSVRVVSMPCAERFLAQSAAYQQQILPRDIRSRVAIEASASGYWYRFVGLDGVVIGLDRFGASAPADAVYADVGLTVESIIEAVNTLHSTVGVGEVS